MLDGRVHFIGAGGYGMRPLAAILLRMGKTVSGSDIKDSAGLRELENMGAEIWIGHSPERIAGSQAVVYSNAVPENDPELREAARVGIQIMPRADLLAMLFNTKIGIGVTGTHGKTTTTGMLVYIFSEAGLDPTVLVGSGMPGLPTGGRYGTGAHMIVEADEAYGTFLKLRPHAGLITNVDDDHRDHYGTYGAIQSAFARYSAAVDPEGFLTVCCDSEDAVQASKAARCRVVSYGLKGTRGYSASSVKLDGLGSEYTLTKDGASICRISLKVPGMHNISNSVGAAALAMEIGLSPEDVARGLSAYRGADRRCQVVSEGFGVLVVDDYAHHPEEVKATLAALRTSAKGRLIAIFQPQRYTRTKLLMDRFAEAFTDADLLLVAEIYYKGTGEEPIDGVSGGVLAEKIAEAKNQEVAFAKTAEEAAEWALSLVKPGDTVVTMGAGDIWKASKIIAERIEDSSYEKKT